MKKGNILGITLAVGIMVIGAGSSFANENNKVNGKSDITKEAVALENGDVYFDSNSVEDVTKLEAVQTYTNEELDELFKDMKPGESKTLDDGSVIGVVDANASGIVEVNLQNPSVNK